MDEVYVIMPESYYLELLYRIEQLEKQLRLSQQQKRSKSCRGLRGKENKKLKYCSMQRTKEENEPGFSRLAQGFLDMLTDEILANRYNIKIIKSHERTESGDIEQVGRNIKYYEPSVLNRGSKCSHNLVRPNMARIVRYQGKPKFK